MKKLAVLLHQQSYQRQNHCHPRCCRRYLAHIYQMTSSQVSSPVCQMIKMCLGQFHSVYSITSFLTLAWITSFH
jgi:hypothetical protein